MKKIDFLPSGCQFWHSNILSSSYPYFAYCSTLAIYIYDISTNQCKRLLSLNTDNLSNIFSCIAFQIRSSNRLASVCTEGILDIWDLEKEKSIYNCHLEKGIVQIEWSPWEIDSLLMAWENGDIKIFDFLSKKIEKIITVLSSPKTIEWNTKRPGFFLIGCEDGILYLYSLLKKKTIKLITQQQTSKSAVKIAKFDFSSPNYILSAWVDGSISLFDCEIEKEIQVFNVQKRGITGLAWIKSIPGGFITCNDKVSGIKIWSVSSKSHIKIIKLGLTGFLNLKNIDLVGKDLFLCSFKNGSVGVLDFNNKRFSFLLQPNHSETIFDISFRPDSPDIFATGSYDGSIKIWNLNKAECFNSFSSNSKNNVVYSISWSPNGKFLISSHSNGEIILWNVENSIPVSNLMVCNGQPIHRIEWNILDQEYIASGSIEGQAIIYKIKNQKITIVNKIKQPMAVYGISWHKFRHGLLLTACHDKTIRLYDIFSNNTPLILNFIGHKERVFNVFWSPILSDTFSSSSDDNTIGVWTLNMPKLIYSSNLLIGHTRNVRALLWSTEINWLLLSGSWDSTIRLWDIRNYTCFYVCKEHQSDVYGLCSHPLRPMIVVSCSRDTSMRVWSLDNLIADWLWNGLIKEEWGSLEGKESNNVVKNAENIKAVDIVGYYEYLLKFVKVIIISYVKFNKRKNAKRQDEFWQIAKRIKYGKSSVANENLLHLDQICDFFNTAALNLELKNSKGFSYNSLDSKIDRLEKASKMYIKICEYEKYCECLIKNNQWDKAISIAPSVSFPYWQSICLRYADFLSSENDADAYAYYILANKTNNSIDLIAKNEDYKDAEFLCYQSSIGKLNIKGFEVIKNENNPKKWIVNKLKEITNYLSEIILNEENCIWAAALHLSINDIEGCIIKLIRGNELEYAYCISKMFETNLTKFVERNIFDILKNNQLKEFINLKYSFINYNLDSVEEYYLKVSEFGKKEFTSNLPEIQIIFQNLNYSKLKELTILKLKYEIIAFNLFFSLYKAIWKGLYPIIVPIYKSLSRLLKAQSSTLLNQLPFKLVDIQYILSMNLAVIQPEKFSQKSAKLINKLSDPEKKKFLTKLLKNITSFSIKESKKKKIIKEWNRNTVHILGNLHPNNKNQIDLPVSLFSKKPIPINLEIILEDSKSYLNREEALMWLQCTPLSPLITGYELIL